MARRGEGGGLHRRRSTRPMGVIAAAAMLAMPAACGDAASVRAEKTSPPRPEASETAAGSGEVCEHFAVISAQWDDDPLGPEMGTAFEEAISLTPPEVADALALLEEGLWLSPEEALAWHLVAAGDAQDLVDRHAVEMCGVSVFDPRVTPDTPEIPSAAETPQTDLGPDYLAERQPLMTEAGGIRVRWEMPTVNLIDGPRQPRNMNPPAIVTYWAHGGTGVLVRYDAMLLVDVGNLGENDDEIAREALLQIGGGAPIQFDASRRASGRLQIDFAQSFDDRVYLGRAYSLAGNVFAITVAIPWDREDLAVAAYEELARFDASLSFEPM